MVDGSDGAGLARANEDQPFRALFQWFLDRGWQMAVLLGGLGLATVPSPLSGSGDWKTHLSWAVSIILVVGGTLGTWRTTPRIKSLQKQINRLKWELKQERADYIDAFKSNLAAFANDQLGFTDHDRISVFRHRRTTGDQGVFVRIGRFSKNPEYAKPGRSVYPDIGGCLGRAWLNGTCFIADLPDPERDLRGWMDEMVKYGIPEDIAQGLRMKSRSYFGIAIADPKDIERVAVLLYESTDPRRFDEAELTKFSRFQGKTVAQFIESKKAEEPDPIDAAKEGW